MSNQQEHLEQLRESQKRLREKYSSVGPSKEVIEHFESIQPKEQSFEDFVEQAKKSMIRKKRSFPKPNFLYPEAKRIFFEIMQSFLNDQNKEIVIDGNSKTIIPELIKYFICDESTKLDLRRGIYIYGKVGPGKSFLMSCFKKFSDVINFEHRQFKVRSVKKLSFDALQKSSIENFGKFKSGVYCFDDIGYEEQDFRLYGTKIQPLEYLIDSRYSLFQKSGLVTHFTSNVPPAKIESIYGKRIYSRILEMSNLVLLTGSDKRIIQPVILK